MKLKFLTAVILCILIGTLPIISMASAETLPQDYKGNSEVLIDIKNPEAQASSTANKVCVISAVAVPGTTVTLYSYDSANNIYTKMYSEGLALETVVGAAGLYAQNIELKQGANNILVVAQSGDAVETAKLDITHIKNSLTDAIRNLWQSIIGH